MREKRQWGIEARGVGYIEPNSGLNNEKIEQGGAAYGDPVWDEVTLVNDKDDLLVGFLLLDIL